VVKKTRKFPSCVVRPRGRRSAQPGDPGRVDVKKDNRHVPEVINNPFFVAIKIEAYR